MLVRHTCGQVYPVVHRSPGSTPAKDAYLLPVQGLRCVREEHGCDSAVLGAALFGHARGQAGLVAQGRLPLAHAEHRPRVGVHVQACAAEQQGDHPGIQAVKQVRLGVGHLSMTAASAVFTVNVWCLGNLL